MRHTRKIKVDTNYFCGYELKNPTYKEMYELQRGEYRNIEIYANGNLTMAIDTLGELEDVLAKHHIKSPAELDEILNRKIVKELFL